MENLKLELEFQDADFERLQQAWQNIITRHALLRSSINADGQLETLDSTNFIIKLYDLSLQATDKIRAVQDKLRAGDTLSSSTWPWFSVRATRYNTGNIRCYFHFAADMLAPEQAHYLLRELLALYQNLDLPLRSLTLSKPTAATATNQHAFTLRYKHLYGRLDHQTLANLREQSTKHNIALPVVLLNAFKNELDRQNYDYPVYMTLANRFPFFPFMYDRACFATSVAACHINDIYTGKFADNCSKIDQQLRQDSQQITDDTMNTLVELPTKLDAMSLFSCSLEQDLPAGPLFAKQPDVIYCNFALPTIDIDYAVWEQGGQLMYRWSYAKVLPEVDASADNSLLRRAYADYPELEEIVADNQQAGMNSKAKALTAAGLVLGGTAGATAAKAKSTKKNNRVPIAAGTTEAIQQANQNNGVLEQSSQDVGNAMLGLANSDDVWQDQKDNDGQSTEDDQPEQTDTNTENNTPETSSGLQTNLAALGAGSAAALLAAAIESLKTSDTTPEPAPAAPTPAALAAMTPEETEQAYDDYSQRVVQMHAAPSKSDMAQQDICSQFTNMADGMGPDVTKVQGELNEMGGTIDKVSTDIAKGDVKSATAGLDKLSGDHLNLTNKMLENGIPGSPEELPINQQANDVYAKVTALNESSSPDEIATASSSIENLDSTLSNYEGQSKDSTKLAEDKLKQQMQVGAESITSQPEFQALQAKTDKVKNLGKEVVQYDCDSISKEASQEKIAELKQQADELQTQIPAPTNPLDEQLGDVSEKATAVKARAEKLKDLSPEQMMQDPGLQSSIDSLNTSAAGMASSVQGQCPICSASKPDLPAVPKCGHNHGAPAMSNPFHLPSMKVDASLNFMQTSNSPNPDILNKLNALKDKLANLNPVPNVPNVTNPYSGLKSTVTSSLKRVSSQLESLNNCPNCPDDVKRHLESTKSSLENSQKRLQALIEQDHAGNTQKKFADLKNNMSSGLQGNMSDVERKRSQLLNAAQAGAMANVTASFACWQSMNMPAFSKGQPDEVLTTMFKCKCPMAMGGPMPIPVKPGVSKISNKDVLIVNGAPLTQPLGACQHPQLWIKAVPMPPPPPCVGIFNVVGGSVNSSSMGMPLGTKSKTQILCAATGTKLQIMDTGQSPKDPVTAM